MGLIFPLGTFCLLERFVSGTFSPWDVLSLGTFCPGHFVPWTFCLGTLLYVHLLLTLGSQQPFLKTFAKAFKGTVAENKCE